MSALKLEPTDIQAGVWYYEETFGIEIIHELPERPGNPLHIKIPWRKLEASTHRHQTDKIVNAAKRKNKR